MGRERSAASPGAAGPGWRRWDGLWGSVPGSEVGRIVNHRSGESCGSAGLESGFGDGLWGRRLLLSVRRAVKGEVKNETSPAAGRKRSLSGRRLQTLIAVISACVNTLAYYLHN